MALLTVGSAVAPKQELIGEVGQKALVAAQEEGKTTGLATFFEKSKDAAKETLLVNGLPPFPSGLKQRTDGNWKAYDYALSENSYPDV